ncbi:MAG: cell division protein FtsL [Peptoniphilaceae bacterium]|nr:cell division protein FtsL [Peptoniphilaceae bacterium]MDY3076093.1 cell division protein FtsL [Peptoniphilaceae bacterium]
MDAAVKMARGVAVPASKKKIQVIAEAAVAAPNAKKNTAVRSRTRVQSMTLPALFSRLFFGLTVLLSVGLLMTSLVSYNQLNVVNRDITKLKQDLDSFQAERDYYVMELAPYLQKDRVETIAREKLKMAYPKEGQVLTVQAASNSKQAEDGVNSAMLSSPSVAAQQGTEDGLTSLER